MKLFRKTIRCVSALFVATLLTFAALGGAATAQAPAPSSASLSEAVVKALQEALTKQGIPIAVSGVLNEETRAAVRKFQTQHHLPVTGDPDKATLDKLGVPSGAATAPSSTLAQAASPAGPGQMSGGMMMSGPMQDHMRGMMQMMQGMMQTMQGQVQTPGQVQPGQLPGSMMQDQMRGMMQMMQGMMQMMQSQMPQGQIPQPQMPGGMMMNGATMQDHMRSMMQMMQGMMQMMPGQAQTPGQAQPGQMTPGQMPPKSP